MLKEPQQTPDFPSQEEKTLRWWDEQKIFQKSIAKNKGNESFVFFEGPPTANGKPHIGHVLGRSYKDLFPRFKTMQGLHVTRKAGWDSHGLPVELEVEKALGISGKKQIEEFGIEKFNQLCRESVFKYISIWEKLTNRMGFWLDLENPYVVLNKEYIESLWWVLKQAWEKELLVKDYKVSPYCPRCQTPISSHELAQGYQDDVEDPSVYVLFEAIGENLEDFIDFEATKKVYFLAWTTTPWTLLGNVALAIDENAVYAVVEEDSRFIIIAKERLAVLGKNPRIVAEVAGTALLKQPYAPLFTYASYDKPAHYLVAADFVDLTDGTGIIHTAVMYGEDDFNLGAQNDLPKQHVVSDAGEFLPTIGPFAGKAVWKATQEVIEALESQGNLYKAETIKHTYPFCWRCKTKLIYFALDSWFLAMTKIKDELLANNASVSWHPEHLKQGRMGDWLRNVKDWSISRWRYWGTPLPIWKCDECDHHECIGSYEELATRSTQKIDLENFDPHRPFIDEITFTCSKCNGAMYRYTDVLDTWFDSGAMPYAQWHYPFENEDQFTEHFPADFICEGIDQTRGWFYTLLAEATILGKPTPTKNILSHELVLDEKGKKMSKSVGNVIDPFEALDAYGADISRWYFYTASQLGKPYRMSMQDLEDVKRRFFNILWNSFRFFLTNANLDGWEPTNGEASPKNILDQWILARLQTVTNTVTDSLGAYDAYTASRAIQNFVVLDISQWYIRRSRDRVGIAATNEEDKQAFYTTMHHVFIEISKLMAPFTPFLAEEMYQIIKTKDMPESVHLTDWQPKTEVETAIQTEMELIRMVAEKAHAARKEAAVKVRQPLQSLHITSAAAKPSDGVLLLLLDETNIKNIEWGTNTDATELKVTLDTMITPELRAEGIVRELLREAQTLRKQAEYAISQEIAVGIESDSEEIKNAVQQHKEWIERKLLTKNLSQTSIPEFDATITIDIDGKSATLTVKKV